MSEQAAPLYIEPNGTGYTIVKSSVAAPPFPDIPLSLVFDLGDALNRVTRKLPPDQAQLVKASLLSVSSEDQAKCSVKLPDGAGRTLWASFTAEEVKTAADRLEKLDWKALETHLKKISVEGIEPDDFLLFLKGTKECFDDGSRRGSGIAFFAYE